MNKTFNLLFYVKKSKAIANGTAPIYLRITIDGKQTEIAAKRYILPEKWNSQAQKVNGTSEEIKTLNAYLKTLEQQVYEAHHQLLKDRATVTTETLKNRLQGTDERIRTIVPIFEEHNNRLEKLIQNDGGAPSTYTRYKTALDHVKNFLQWKYNISDIDITKIDHPFITDFEFYLRTEKKCNNNTAVKYVRSNFGKIIRNCIKNKWLTEDPFIGYDSTYNEVNRTFLDQNEISTITNKILFGDRLNIVRDIFLFSCYTGLAYIDTTLLNRKNICIGIDGHKWIIKDRKKTNTASNIPLLPMALEILDKYKNHPQCINRGSLLPIISNQKMNSYLKEIADICKIPKELTFHIARHTFATTVTLSNGVSMESVSKMLGHKKLTTTQHYAKILDRKVSDDMNTLREKFKLISQTNTTTPQQEMQAAAS